MSSEVLQIPALGQRQAVDRVPPPHPARRPPRAGFLHAAAVTIAILDWATPPGVVVAILLSLPILLASMMDETRVIWQVATVAAIGFVLAAVFGAEPISPPALWIPNRVLACLSVPASAALAVLLQRQRLAAERARDEAMAARDLNRLLMSLLAHDLRSPLTLANEGIVYVENSVARGAPIDTGLLDNIRARLRRSLRALEVILTVVRSEVERRESAAAGERPDGTAAAGSTQRTRSTARVRQELLAEVAAFTHEAGERRKLLATDFEALPDDRYLVDILVVRQALAILLDNAIRYAGPGTIHVAARLEDGMLVLTVADPGPAVSVGGAARLDSRTSRGLGLGLELCRALVRHAGGTLETLRSDAAATVFALRLPIERAAADGGPTV